MTMYEAAARADKLQACLGEGYTVHYDYCESCKTAFLYKGILYKEVPDTEIENPNLNVSDYRVPYMLYDYTKQPQMYWKPEIIDAILNGRIK